MMIDQQEQTDQRNPYAAPTLTIYGDITKLTAGGTGTVDESPGNTPLTKRP